MPPRDRARRSTETLLRRRASSPVAALSAFSALVALSVAVSSGMGPGADTGRVSASGVPAVSGQQGRGEPSLLAAGPEPVHPPAAPLRDDRSASPVRDGAAGNGSWQEGLGRGDADRGPASTARPGRRAPALYEGDLPVNTLIAPATPGTVLVGGDFGWRIAPDRGHREFHNGTDISAAEGLPVVAALDGVVTAVFWDVWGGNRVEVAHADGLKTTYNHLEDVRVRVGDRLAASERLGSVGATGIRVTGPHLHFETWVDGKAVDPQSFDWIDGRRVIPASREKYSLEAPEPAPADDGRVLAAPAAPATPEPGKKAEPEKAETSEPKRTVPKDAKAEKPVPEAERPAPGAPKPAPEAGKPAPGAPKPAPEAGKPAPGAPKPARKTEKPTPGAQKPAPKAEKPVPEAGKPAPEVQKPAPEAGKPAPEIQKPAPGAQKPAPEAGKPAPGAQKPAPEAGKPAPGGQEPTPAPVPPVATPPVVTPPGAEKPVVDEPAVERPRKPVHGPDSVRDIDGDGILDVHDNDLDDDKLDNAVDDDIDGDKKPNAVDDDIDGDGLLNAADGDIDGDGLPNDEDPDELVPAPITAPAPAE